MISVLDYLRRSRRGGGRYGTESRVETTLIEILIYLFFLIFATIASLMSRDTLMFYFTENIEKLFVKRITSTVFGEEFNYEEIVTSSDWWEWMDQTFINGLYGHEENPNLDEAERYVSQSKLTDYNVLLGPPRIRQKRVRGDTCHIHQVFKTYFRKCFGPFTESNEDKKEIPLNSKYLTSNEMNSYGTWGKVNSYSGGGFVEMFSLDRGGTTEVLKGLKQGEWIDRGTRLLIVEFSLYNTNVNYFCMAQFVIEVVPSGGFETSTLLRTFKLFPMWTWRDIFPIICLILYYLMIVYYTIEEIFEFTTLGILYFASLWNWVDIMIILIGYFSFIYNIVNPITMYAFLRRFEENPEEFNSIEKIAFWNLIYVEIMAVNIFLIWIKIFKFISFNKTMLQFSTTLSRCAKDLAGFSVMFIIIFLAYAQMGLLIFGNQHPQFQDFSESFVTMVRMVLGDFEYEGLEKANRLLGPIFFISYILLVFFILLNMFLAIINDTYTEVKNDVNKGNTQFEKYIKKLLRKLWNLCTCRKNKEDESKPLTDEENPSENKGRAAETPSPRAKSEPLRSDKVLKEYFEMLNDNEQMIEELKKRMEKIEKLLIDLSNKFKKLLDKIEKSKRKTDS